MFVNKEYAPEIEWKRRVLLPILRAAKSIEGYKRQIRLENNKIVIKGKDYDIKNIHELPEDLNAFKVTSKENDTTVGFFGELNPLSNFFPASFQTKGQHYISSEQFIQASKAQYFGDTGVYNQIMGCNNDRLWGTGIPLAHPDSLNSDRWITPGIMGKILEDIRLEFCSHYPPLLNSMSNSPVFHHTNTSMGEPKQLIPPITSSISVMNKNPTNLMNLRPNMFCSNKSNSVAVMTGSLSMDVAEDQPHKGPSASDPCLQPEISTADETSRQQSNSERDKEF